MYRLNGKDDWGLEMSVMEIERAVRAKEPKLILEAVAGLIGQRVEYWPLIDESTAQPSLQRSIAHDLGTVVEQEAERGFINEDERRLAQEALGQV
jgi:hypothetical protein